MINAIHIALSGLSASTKKAETAASNIANLNSTGSLEDPAHAPYSTLTTVQNADSAGGVRARTIPKSTPFVPSYDPGSPFAGEDGTVGVPNTDLAEEAVNLTLAKTAYKASLKVIQTASDMSRDLLEIFGHRD